MTKYRVWIPVVTEIYLTLDVELTQEDVDNGLELEDKIIEEAAEEMPGSLCYQCSGYRSAWGREEGEPDWDRFGFEPVDD